MSYYEIEEICALVEMAEECALAERGSLGFVAFEPVSPEFEDEDDGLEQAWRELFLAELER